jgi:predicted metal-dependent HD superfamily phosphohydrolase
MARLGTGPHGRIYESLVAAYAQPHRHYHTAAHIDACLREFDTAAALAQFPDEVEVALWFHDAVYVPGASDNEGLSAEWAVRFLAEAGVVESSRQRVYSHVMATRHDTEAVSNDSALVTDIDLSILGQAPAVYARFERDVREEYRSVPQPLYDRKRCAVLQGFLAREFIYALPHFRARYEDRARTNVDCAIRALRESGPA